MSGYQGSYNHYGGVGGGGAAPNSYSKVNSFGANPVRAKMSGGGAQGLGGVGAHILGPAHLPKLGERGASRSKLPGEYSAVGGGYGGYGGGGSSINSGGGNYGSLGNYGGGGGRIAPRLSGLNHGGIGGGGGGSYQPSGGFGGGGFGSMSGNNGGGNEFSYGRY